MKESILLLDTLMQVALMEQDQEKKLQLLKQISSKCHKLTMDLFNSIDQLNQIRTNALNKVDEIEIKSESITSLDDIKFNTRDFFNTTLNKSLKVSHE